jgi:hypothetical protein
MKNSLDKWAPTLYFIIGQSAWFACVLSAAHDIPWTGITFAAVLLLAHLLRARRPVQEIKLLLTIAGLGAAWDSLMVWGGFLGYPHGTNIPGFAPLWIVMLWALFAAQFNTTYQWLKTRVAVAALLGAVAGPLSFRTGASLGAVQFLKPVSTALLLALGWGALLPVTVFLSRRFDGVTAYKSNFAKVSR